MEKMQEFGWYLTEHGFDLVTDFGNITDIQKIIRRAAEHDLKEISSGEGDINDGCIILQIQKLRNVAAPKNNEESKAAPRMLKLSLSDGKNSFQAVEVEHISSISLSTPPGTKILLKGSLTTIHGIILLRASNVAQVLIGKVANLVERWELNKKLATHSRLRSVEEGGPPPWIPFGKKIVKVVEQGKNFKSLAEPEKPQKENDEFEAQRKDAIAEVAKQACKKVFGGGNVQLLDHSVQKIVDHGFSIEQAEHALKVNRNNVDKALRSLRKNENRNSREPRELKGKRNEKKAEDILVQTKPSSGKLSLFDFLEDKLPVQLEPPEKKIEETYNKDRSNNYDRGPNKVNTRNQNPRAPKNPKGPNKGYQVPPRHSDENRVIKKSTNVNSPNSQQYGQYTNSNLQKTKPPRFQRNQENSSSYYEEPKSYDKFPSKFTQGNEYRNSTSQYNQSVDSSTSYQDFSYNSYSQNYQNYQEKPTNNYRNYNTLSEIDNRNKQYDTTFTKSNRLIDRVQESYQPNTFDNRNYNSIANNYYCNENLVEYNANNIQSNSYYNSSVNESSGSSWFWKVGDKCMAKYWEDNMYYNAEVTAVSDRTCVVQFQDFFNYEEVLKADCIPITEDTQNRRFNQDNRREVRTNRPPRFEQNQNSGYGENRRGGGGVNSKSFRRRDQQRGAQPIYQPPAQRSNTFINHNS